MKLSHSTRRSYRRPARPQGSAFFTNESSGHAPPLFAAPQGESRQRAEAPFLQSREDQVKPQEEEEVQARAQEEDASKAQEEEEAAQPQEEEQAKAQEEEEAQAQEEEEAAKPKAKKDAGAPVAEGPSLSRKRAMAESAVGSAKTMAGRAVATLKAARKSAVQPGDSRDALGKYECWFGEFDDGRAGFVQGIFERIQRDLTASDLLLFFNGTRREYAHVDPGDGGLKIWLSRLFWQKAGGSGFNSRPSTLLHELSHKASAEVDDFRYGPGPCKG